MVRSLYNGEVHTVQVELIHVWRGCSTVQMSPVQ